jgi:ribosomal protein L11 methyltransferase
MNTIQFSIVAGEAEQELLISELSELGATGFEQTETNLLAYFPEAPFDSYAVSEVLKAYVFTQHTLEEKNWNAEWEHSFEPVVVDDFCGIRAHFHQPLHGLSHEIVITPKMSFGTGHHATTFLMIRQMRGLDFWGKRVFDFGTGTGILSILAEKMGAEKIDAIDVDDWSIRNAEENIGQNNCSKITVTLGSKLPQAQYDLVLANINRNVILDYLPALKGLLANDGRLLVSGLLASDETDIRQAFAENGLQFVTMEERNNWICLLFVK